MSSDAADTTLILQQARGGDPDAVKALLPLVYDELRSIAANYLRNERAQHTLQPTALIHEAYIRLIDQKSVAWEDRMHFCSVAARFMRQILVDHARRRGAIKRGGDRQAVTLDGALAHCEAQGVDVIDLNDALEALSALDERKSQVVELRFFGGLTCAEIARVLGIAEKTVEADWYMARAWLKRSMTSGDTET
jgi:RNA polymerase sigma factor (TIGR02999 family)